LDVGECNVRSGFSRWQVVKLCRVLVLIADNNNRVEHDLRLSFKRHLVAANTDLPDPRFVVIQNVVPGNAGPNFAGSQVRHSCHILPALQRTDIALTFALEVSTSNG